MSEQRQLSVVPRLDRTLIRETAEKLLSEALERVRSGETAAIVLIEQNAVDDVMTDYSGSMNAHKLVFGLEHLKHKILSRLHD